ncbi:MAG: hypothetical protein E7H57_09160, partial [Pantoea sp.]|nr:hypothetical protein [Pantoea sp.]
KKRAYSPVLRFLITKNPEKSGLNATGPCMPRLRLGTPSKEFFSKLAVDASEDTYSIFEK